MSAATATVIQRTSKILVASSSTQFRARMLKSLPPVKTCSSEANGGADALIKLEAEDFGALVLDPQIEDLDIGELVATIQRRFPQVNVVIAESDGTLQQGVLDFGDETAVEEAQSESSAPVEDLSESLEPRANVFSIADEPQIEPLRNDWN